MRTVLNNRLFGGVSPPRRTTRKVVVGLVLVGKLHRGGCVIQRSEQILFHVSDRAAVLCKALEHKTDMVGVQLHKATAYHLGGLIVPGDVQQLTVGGTGVHQQIYDLVDSVLLIRAEPEQKVYLQRLRKYSSSWVRLLIPSASSE